LGAFWKSDSASLASRVPIAREETSQGTIKEREVENKFGLLNYFNQIVNQICKAVKRMNIDIWL